MAVSYRGPRLVSAVANIASRLMLAVCQLRLRATTGPMISRTAADIATA